MLSKRMQGIKMSPTLALVGKVKELQEKGLDIISLTVGEPDWMTYPPISEAGISAIQTGFTKYTAPQGTLELRRILARRFSEELGASYNPNEVVVASGSKLILYGALQALCNPGEEVILPVPYWVSYTALVEMAEAKVKPVSCGERNHFKLTPSLLQEAIGPKTRVLLLCSPSNPTGIMYTRNELEGLVEVIKAHPNLFVISDDIYNRLVFDGNKVAPHILHVAPELKERVLSTNGGSKTYAMTGWRIGWAAGPAPLIKGIGDFQSQATGSPSSIAQYAVTKGIDQCEPFLQETIKTLIRRRDLGMKALSTVRGLKAYQPDGAFYFWCDIKAFMGKKIDSEMVQNSQDFCRVLLERYHVAAVPGSESGAEGYIRFSFAVEEDKFQKAVERIRKMTESFQT